MSGFEQKFLVIDDEELLKCENLQRRVNLADKHPQPVLRMDASWDCSSDWMNYINVLYDEEQGLFIMWYVVAELHRDQYWEGARKTGYATSRDGIHWERPVMNMVEVKGSKENNYILPEMGSMTYTIIEDPSDVRARRYKMIFQVESSETRWARYHIPLCLAYSEDGISWDRPVHVNPILRGVSDAAWGFFYDSDRRKYVLLTRRVPNLPRDISQYESYDLVNWEDKGRVLAPGDEHDPPDMYNFQSMTPFRYGDYYLALLSTQYTLPESESYECFQPPPPGYPNQRLGNVDVQLAYSRDGQKWERPDDRSPLIANGEAGSQDAGTIFIPMSAPIVREGETWIYYLGHPLRHSSRSQTEQCERVDYDARQLGSVMLAKMPEDHWISLEAGEEEGSFLCKPWGPPHDIFVNADIGEGGYVAVELLTPYGETMPGFGRENSIPVTEGGPRQRAGWKNGDHPWSHQQQHIGGVCVRFLLKNAKLYSYTFTLPEDYPHTALALREQTNARWLEIIKHRSDNPDRLNNAPADSPRGR